MPIFQQLVDFDEELRLLPGEPIIINDLSDTSEEDKETVKNIVATRYSSNLVSLIPTCRCGNLQGEFSTGLTCEDCGTMVVSDIETDISPLVWLRKPAGVTALINPVFWIMLRERFTKSGFNAVEWLVNPRYVTRSKNFTLMSKLETSGLKRGYNNFVENFDLITDFLFNITEYKLRRKDTDFLREMITRDRHCLFSEYLPLPNKSLLIIESTNVGVYVDPVIVKGIDAIQMLVSLDRNFYDQDPGVKEARTIKAITKLAAYYEDFIKSNLAPKNGHFRRHIYGSRTNFSFRTVVTSLTDDHDYDEIRIPWGVGLTVFRHHLVNKLSKLGMDLNSSIGLIYGHVEKHHDLLAKLLQELIDESGNRLYCILQRNPTLNQGSAQRFRLTVVKDGPRRSDEQCDNTTSLPIEAVKSMNADTTYLA